MDTHSPAPVQNASRRMSFDTATTWALSLTGVLAAIAFIPGSSLSFIYTKVFILALGAILSLALYIIARLARGNMILPPLTLVGALWLVPLAYLLSAFFSGKGIASSFYGTQLESDTAGFVVVVALIATLTALAFRRTEQYRTFFVVAAATYALVVISQVAFIIASRVAPGSVSASTNIVGSFTDMGTLVGLGVVLLLITLRLCALSRARSVMVYVGVALGLFLLALVNSSVIWAVVGLVALGLFIEVIMHRGARNAEADMAMGGMHEASAPSSHGNRMLVPSLVVLVASVFFLLGNSTIGQSVGNTFGVSVIDVRPSWQSTLTVASKTYETSALFGSGPGTFVQQWLKYRDQGINNTIFWNIDFVSGVGYVPTSFITTGIVGVLAWILFLALFLIFGIRFLLFRAPSEDYLRFVAVTAFAASAYLLTMAVIAIPGPVVLALMFLMIGIFVSTTRFEGERRELGIVFARNPRLGFLVVFALTIMLLGSVGCAYVTVGRYVADLSYNQAAAALSRGDTGAAYAAATRSTTFVQSDRTYELVALTALTEMNRIVNDPKLPQETARVSFQAALSKGIDAALTATRLAPNNYLSWMTLGNVYQAVVPLNIDGAYQNAKTAYEHAVTLNPTNPTLSFTLAQLEIANKNYAKAEDDLKTTISLKNNYTQAIFLYSQLQASQGKAEEALKTAEAAAYFAPNDPSVLFQVGILQSATGDNTGAIATLTRATELNPQYANAQFFLGVSYAIKRQYDKALTALQAAAALSPENAKALEADIAALTAGKNPFPASSLGALGISQTPVTEKGTPASADTTTAPAVSKP